jgi:hypothetical protein
VTAAASDVRWPDGWRDWPLSSIDVKCPTCAAPPGQVCDWRGGRTARVDHLPAEEVRRTPHLTRMDRAVRVWRKRKASEAER